MSYDSEKRPFESELCKECVTKCTKRKYRGKLCRDFRRENNV